MRLTFVHPAVGRKPGVAYMRSWQMEPLPIAALAGLTPPDIETAFYDDRLEAIDFDRPADLVAIPVETYTARRAYQIASEFRRRGVPVVMGGFHATLAPDEVGDYAEAVVIGEAEGVWAQVIDDARAGRLQRVYRSAERPDMALSRFDRRIFAGKTYLPIRLVETGRGCKFPCEFCAVQSFFERSARRRPVADVVAELAATREGARFHFFVDDNFAADPQHARELLRAIAPLKLAWVTQMSINAAHDESFVRELAAAGCVGVLIGFETLDPQALRAMRKSFNAMKSGYDGALKMLARHGVSVYGTFVFGYGGWRAEAFEEAADFAIARNFYIAAFNHLTPFPGTPLYERLQREGRLIYDRWWLDGRYRYNDLPFRPEGAAPEDVRAGCLAARRKFYGLASIGRRALAPAMRAHGVMLRAYLPINLTHRAELSMRDRFPLGDPQWRGALLKVA